VNIIQTVRSGTSRHRPDDTGTVSSADMTDYDKAGRYFIKRNPPGFFCWLLRLASVRFHAWIDTRRHALPQQGDLTNDLVAALITDDGFEAFCVELQAESEGGSAERLLLGYLPRLLTEPPAPDSLTLASVGGVVINLTGPPQPGAILHQPTLAPECSLSGSILQRTLRDIEATETLAAISAGEISRWLLAWLPLMRGGGAAGIIEGWKREALKEPSERDRRILAHLTLTFARLGKRLPAWTNALEGWAVQKSEYLEELREDVRKEAREEGLSEGLAKGQRAGLLRTILSLGQQRFGKAASRKQKAQLEGIDDLARLERISDRLLQVTTWADLLATP
jgi:hypothetical protein